MPNKVLLHPSEVELGWWTEVIQAPSKSVTSNSEVSRLWKIQSIKAELPPSQGIFSWRVKSTRFDFHHPSLLGGSLKQKKSAAFGKFAFPKRSCFKKSKQKAASKSIDSPVPSNTFRRRHIIRRWPGVTHIASAEQNILHESEQRNPVQSSKQANSSQSQTTTFYTHILLL